MTRDGRPDVLVVGGGIIGCSVAIELAGRKAPVTLLETDQPGTRATGASAGMVAPQYEADPSSPLFRFGLDSARAYPAFVARLEELGEWRVGFRRDGMLVANRSAGEEEDARRDAEWQRREGLLAELLDASEARRIHADLSPGVRSWLWLPDQAQLNAQLLAVGLHSAVRRSGADVRHGARVTRIRTAHARVVGVRLESGEDVDASAVVVAAGAWSPAIDGLPRPLPVRPVRGQMLRLRPDHPVPWPLVATHDGHYVVPRENGTVLCGSTMEERGFEDAVTEEGQEEIATHAAGLVPAIGEAPVVERWAGLRPLSADRMPLLGPEPLLEGLFYATGHGRNGILLAPLTARVVADLVLEGSSPLPWQPFSATRL